MAKFERKYICVKDLQGGSFAVGRTHTIEDWRKQALEWLYQDDAEEDYIRFIKKLNKKYVIDEIASMWALKIIPIEELDIESMFYAVSLIDENAIILRKMARNYDDESDEYENLMEYIISNASVAVNEN